MECTGVEAFVEKVARAESPLAGGAAVALVGALGAALTEFVARLAANKGKTEAREIIERAAAIRRQLMEAIAKDAVAVGGVLEARRLPQGTIAGEASIEEAMRRATEVPFTVAVAAFEVLDLARQVVRLDCKSALGDVMAAAYLARAAIEASAANVRLNTCQLKDQGHAQVWVAQTMLMSIEAGRILNEIIRVITAAT